MTHALLSLVFAGLLARSAWTDIIHRRIPNRLVGLIVLHWPLQALSLEPGAAVAALLIALGVLSVGVLVWTAGWLGAGDAKLLAAVALWAGAEHSPAALLVTVTVGAAIGMALLTIRSWRALLPSMPQAAGGGAAMRGLSARLPAKPGSRSVPYAVAIAAGGFLLAARLVAG